MLAVEMPTCQKVCCEYLERIAGLDSDGFDWWILMGSPKVRDFHLSFVHHSHSQTYKSAYFSSTFIDHQLVETHSYQLFQEPYWAICHKWSLTSSKNMVHNMSLLDHETVVDCQASCSRSLIPTWESTPYYPMFQGWSPYCGMQVVYVK